MLAEPSTKPIKQRKYGNGKDHRIVSSFSNAVPWPRAAANVAAEPSQSNRDNGRMDDGHNSRKLIKQASTLSVDEQVVQAPTSLPRRSTGSSSMPADETPLSSATASKKITRLRRSIPQDLDDSSETSDEAGSAVKGLQTNHSGLSAPQDRPRSTSPRKRTISQMDGDAPCESARRAETPSRQNVTADSKPASQERTAALLPAAHLDAPSRQRSLSYSPVRPGLIGRMSSRTDQYETDSQSSVQSSPERKRGLVRTHSDASASGSNFGSPERRKLGRGSGITAASSAPELDNQSQSSGTGSIHRSPGPREAATEYNGIRRVKPVRMTYAQQRSFMSDVDLSGQGSFSHKASFSHLKPNMLTMRTTLPGRGQAGLFDTDDHEEPDNSTELHSLHDLRSAGDGKRFADELAYLLEGFQPSLSASTHKSSATEFIRQLANDDFLHKLRTYSYVSTSYRAFKGIAERSAGIDKILSMAFLLFLLRCCQDTSATEQLLSEDAHGCVAALCEMLNAGACLDLQAASTNIAKADRRHFTTLVSASASCRIAEKCQKTTHALALRAASHIVEHISGAPDMQCLSESQLFRIALTTAKRLSNSDQQAQHETLPDCCRIIDALALQRASVSDLLEHEDTLARETAEVLGDLVVRSRAAASSINAQTAASNLDDLICLLKTLVTLSNASITLCRAVAQSRPVVVLTLMQIIHQTKQGTPRAKDSEKDAGESATSFDLLCLSIGILENLLESAPTARLALSGIKLGAECREACHQSCSCPEREKAMTILTKLYASMTADGDAIAELISKYCALCIIYAVVDAPLEQQEVANQLGLQSKILQELGSIASEMAQLGAQGSAVQDVTSLRSLADRWR